MDPDHPVIASRQTTGHPSCIVNDVLVDSLSLSRVCQSWHIALLVMALDAWLQAKKDQERIARVDARHRESEQMNNAQDKGTRYAAKQPRQQSQALLARSKQLSNISYQKALLQDAQTRQHVYLPDVERELLAKWIGSTEDGTVLEHIKYTHEQDAQ